MDDIWSLLELEPTADVSAIKRAYAKQTRKYHPEEDPEGFLRLREAYQAALDYAENGPSPAPDQQADNDGENAPAEPESEAASEPEGGWTLAEEPEDGPDPYEGGEAIGQFLALYTGKRRRDPKAWMDYFTSPAFLDAAWDGRFTALLLEQVTRLEGETPPSKEFLKWLAVAYQYEVSVLSRRGPDGRDMMGFDLYDGAAFEGIDAIFRIAAKGPAPQRHRGNELAILTSFTEYRCLLRLAERGDWGEEAVAAFTNILGRYVVANLRDSCPQRAGSEPERHPAGLRLIIHFFRGRALPEELYRIAWQKFDLRTAVMGRAGVLYGPLRKIILERLPEIAGEAQENFMPLNKAHSGLREVYWTKDEQKIQAALDAFFARADLMRALKNHRFVENNLLSSWTADWAEAAFLERLLALYETAPDLPSAGQVTERIRQSLAIQGVRLRTEADLSASVPEGPLTLRNGPFFRHWLNTGFYQASDPETNLSLLAYLGQELPYLPEWSRRFLAVEDGTIPAPKCVTCEVDGVKIEVRFHLRYMDFWVDGRDRPIARPCLFWEQLHDIADTDAFFFLLPLAISTYDRYGEVRAELVHRLADTAAPEDGRALIAACLAGHVCRLPVPEEGGEVDMTVLPVEWFAEDAEHLYGCAWFEQEQALAFFEQTFQGRRSASDDAYYEVAEPQAASEMARQLLAEAVKPSGIHPELMSKLPSAVYTEPDTAAFSSVNGPKIPRELLGKAVTLEQLATLFGWLSEWRLKRLELSWPSVFLVGEEEDYPAVRSLVFLKEPAGWVCLYFDDAHAESYALIARPDLYGEGEDSRLIPFRQGELFSHNIHRGFATIRPHLDQVFHQVGFPNNVNLQAGGVWSYAVPVCHGRHKYNLDKRLLGGFPEARSYNRAGAPFYVPLYPVVVSCVSEDGTTETWEIGDKDRDRVQQALTGMMRGGMARLRMTWGDAPGSQRHVVVLRDQDRFMLACLTDRNRRAEFRAADQRAYLAAEGKKYAREVFRGWEVPAYLVHKDSISLRCGLEDLLASIHEPGRVTGRFGAYAPEEPTRSYEEAWAEFVGED